MTENGPLRLGLSGKSLQARPRRTGGTPDPVLPAGAHHQRGQLGTGRLRTRKHPPGDCKEGGPEGAGPGEEGARSSQDEKRTPTRTCGSHVGGAGAEERGDPEVPRRVEGGLRLDLGTHWASGRNRQQGPAVRLVGGIRRPNFRQIPILVKYSRMMNNLFAEIKKVVPLGGIPPRVPYQGPPGSPTGTLYEEVGEVAFMQNPPTTADPSQQGGG